MRGYALQIAQDIRLRIMQYRRSFKKFSEATVKIKDFCPDV